jgi:hypothetical protein
MSGAEFVAVLGIAASAIQVLESCAKIIDRIRQFDQAVAFDDLKRQLQLFSKDVDNLRSPNGRQGLDPTTEAVLAEVLGGCRRQLEKLDKLVQSLVPGAESSKLRRTLYGVRSVKKDKEIREILGILSTYRSAIQLHLARCNTQNTAQILKRISLLEEKISMGRTTAPQLPTENGIGLLALEENHTALIRPQTKKLRQNRKRSSRCARGICNCPCHISIMGPTRSWMPTVLLQTVLCSCEDREYSMAMHLFRTIYSLKLSLHWQDGVSITCSLNYYGMVNYTSPGFMVLYRCEEGLMSLQEARNELRLLREKGEISFKEVDPSGKGWIEASPPILESCSKV